MKRNLKKLLFPILLIAICALMVGVGSGLFVVSTPDTTVDYVATNRYVERDGTVADVYASGDQYYNYLHDGAGRMLVENDGYLYYATLKDGAPVASTTRWNAPARKVRATATMGAAEIDFAANPDLLREFPSDAQPMDATALVPEQQIANNVIFIRFKDDTTNIISEGVKHAFDNTERKDETLRDYFQTISSGKINIYNVLPTKEDGSIFVYTDVNPRSYYENAKEWNRNSREKELLSAALAAAKPYLEHRLQKLGLSTDTDRDGAVDSLNFMIMGSSSDTWSTLLWPHQWDMKSIGVNIRLGAAVAARYSFQFTVSNRFFAVLTHEMGHVFGAEDLYHYGNTNYDPVRFYDNMASSSPNPPNYWFAHTRNKYLGVVEGWQIEDIVTNWDGYTLRAVSAAQPTDTLAYRLRLNATEFLYLEYRKPNVGKYDNNFDRALNSVASGLVAYRVVEGVKGNSNAVAPGTGYRNNPDEVYVYRHRSIEAAALSLKNPTMGSATSTATYADGNIYTKDGKNTNVVITVLEEDIKNNAIRFQVQSPDLPTGGTVHGNSKLVGISTQPIASEPQPVVEVPYDQDISLKIYPKIQKNGIEFISFSALSEDCYTVSDYNRTATDGVPQTVLVSLKPDAQHGYFVEEGAVIAPISIQIVVVDYDVAIEVINFTSPRFPISQTDGFVADWCVKTAMGKQRNYNATSPETGQLTYLGIDKAEVGKKFVTIVFLDLSLGIEIDFYDKPQYYNYVGDERLLYGNTEVGDFKFQVFYESGATRNVVQTATKVGYDPFVFGAQTLRSVWEEDGKEYVASPTVYAYKIATGATPYKLKYQGQDVPREIPLGYAAALSLTDYSVVVNCADGIPVTLDFKNKYDAAVLHTSSTTLKFTYPEIVYQNKSLTVEFRLKVETKVNDAVLSLKGFTADINYQTKVILLKKPMSAQDLLKLVTQADHLSVTLSAKGTQNAANTTLKVQNTVVIDGVAQMLDVPNFTFTVLLKGDANLDGATDSKDIDAMAQCLVGNRVYTAQQLDFDADGRFTFADFSRWLIQLSVTEDSNAA